MNSHLLYRWFKLMYKSSVFFLRVGIIILIIGLVLGFIGKGWLISIIGVIVTFVSVILGNIPTRFLVKTMISFDKSISVKDATKIAQEHLRSKSFGRSDTYIFLEDFISKAEKKSN